MVTGLRRELRCNRGFPLRGPASSHADSFCLEGFAGNVALQKALSFLEALPVCACVWSSDSNQRAAAACVDYCLCYITHKRKSNEVGSWERKLGGLRRRPAVGSKLSPNPHVFREPFTREQWYVLTAKVNPIGSGRAAVDRFERTGRYPSAVRHESQTMRLSRVSRARSVAAILLLERCRCSSAASVRARCIGKIIPPRFQLSRKASQKEEKSLSKTQLSSRQCYAVPPRSYVSVNGDSFENEQPQNANRQFLMRAKQKPRPAVPLVAFVRRPTTER